MAWPVAWMSRTRAHHRALDHPILARHLAHLRIAGVVAVVGIIVDEAVVIRAIHGEVSIGASAVRTDWQDVEPDAHVTPALVALHDVAFACAGGEERGDRAAAKVR